MENLQLKFAIKLVTVFILGAGRRLGFALETMFFIVFFLLLWAEEKLLRPSKTTFVGPHEVLWAKS